MRNFPFRGASPTCDVTSSANLDESPFQDFSNAQKHHNLKFCHQKWIKKKHDTPSLRWHLKHTKAHLLPDSLIILCVKHWVKNISRNLKPRLSWESDFSPVMFHSLFKDRLFLPAGLFPLSALKSPPVRENGQKRIWGGIRSETSSSMWQRGHSDLCRTFLFWGETVMKRMTLTNYWTSYSWLNKQVKECKWSFLLFYFQVSFPWRHHKTGTKP